LAQRARIVLLAADGVSNTEIADRVGVSRPTVIDWRARYERSGIAGLDDEPRSGRPRSVDHDAIITATLTPPPKRLGVTHWSSRLLARHLKIGNATVARAWRDCGVQPWRSQTFKFHRPAAGRQGDQWSGCPAPPENAVVLCVDEKSQIQGSYRADAADGPVCPNGVPTTICGTAPPRCSRRWRSRPAR
jgi:transposase-like protein